jgi:hypothetical protein
MDVNFVRTGAELIGTVSADPASDLRDAERELAIELPDELRALLLEIKGAVFFSKGAKYIPDVSSGLEDREGFLWLVSLYGPGHGDNSLLLNNRRYRDQIPATMVTIGDSPGGSQICLERESGKIFFWNHEAEFDEDTLTGVADLIPDDVPADESAPKIVESESFLDF